MKKEYKFIVFKSDGSNESSQLTVVTFDKNGIAKIIRRVVGFFEDFEEKIKEICEKLCPPMTDETKDTIEHLLLLQTNESDKQSIQKLLEQDQ